MYNKAKQQGFSIIELLIVVAIIAILLLVALPQYQNYTMRAQVSEAMSLSAGPKQALGTIAATDGAFASTVTNINTGKGKYISTGTVTSSATDTALITYTFGGDAHSKLKNEKFILEGKINNGQIEWSCRAENSTSDVASALPSSC